MRRIALPQDTISVSAENLGVSRGWRRQIGFVFSAA
jgi:hypothetical protein